MAKTKKDVTAVQAANKAVFERLQTFLATLLERKAVLACTKEWLAIDTQNLEEEFVEKLREMSMKTLILDATTRASGSSVFSGYAEQDNVLLLIRGYATAYPAPRWPYAEEARQAFSQLPKATREQKNRFNEIEAKAIDRFIAEIAPAEAVSNILNAQSPTTEDQKKNEPDLSRLH